MCFFKIRVNLETDAVDHVVLVSKIQVDLETAWVDLVIGRAKIQVDLDSDGVYPFCKSVLPGNMYRVIEKTLTERLVGAQPHLPELCNESGL